MAPVMNCGAELQAASAERTAFSQSVIPSLKDGSDQYNEHQNNEKTGSIWDLGFGIWDFARDDAGRGVGVQRHSGSETYGIAKPGGNVNAGCIAKPDGECERRESRRTRRTLAGC